MQVSQSVCFEIVSKQLNSSDFTIIDFRKISFGEVKGYLGQHSSLEVTILRKNAEEKHTFFVKGIPTVPSQRNFINELNGIPKERFFFTTFNTLLKENSIHLLDCIVPKCFYSDEECFIYEDLTLQGYKPQPTRTFFGMESVKSVLKALAKLHASAIILEEKKSLNLKDSYPEIFTDTFYNSTGLRGKFLGSYKYGLDACIDLLEDDPKMSKKLFKEKVLEGFDLLSEVEKPSTRFRNTICHGDLWTSNVMFKFVNGQIVNCMIVDFQTYRYGPPGQDVMAFLYLSTSREFREKHLEEVLGFYFKQFDKNVKDYGLGGIITEEEFLNSCTYYKRFALTQTCTHAQVIHMSNEIASELLGNADNAFKVLYENKYDFMVDACTRDPVYKKMNLDPLEELRDFYA